MKTYKIISEAMAPKPSKSLALHLIKEADGFVCRWFERVSLRDDFYVGNLTGFKSAAGEPVSAMPAMNQTWTKDLQQVDMFTNDVVVEGDAISEELEGIHFREFSRTRLKATNVPSVGGFGHGEIDDLASYTYGLTRANKVYSAVPLYTESYATKGSVARVMPLLDAMPVFTLLATHHDDNPDNWGVVRMSYGDLIVFTGDFVDEDTELTGMVDVRSMFFPSFSISGADTVAADGTVTLTATVATVPTGTSVNYASDLYIEASAGYLPKKRVPVVNGTATFKVTALGLAAGDTIKVKIGTRFLTGLASKTITVE